MASCAVCRKNKAQYACSHSCHTLYCSSVCAEIDWSKQQHYLACGDFLDELPPTALVEVLSNLSFKQVYESALLSKKFASIINTYSFRKAFALKHKGEWEQQVAYWAPLWETTFKVEELETWIPILLETKVWNPSKLSSYQLIKKASARGLTNLVRHLLSDPRMNPVEPNIPGWSRALDFAALKGHTEIVKLLLADPRIDPTAEESNCIQEACRWNQPEVLRILLNDGRANPGAFNSYALREASMFGHTKIVEMLLRDPRVDPHANNDEALKDAMANGHTDIVKLLQDADLQSGAESNMKRLKLGRKLF